MPTSPVPGDSVPSVVPNNVREILGAVPTLARVAWFALGAMIATAVTMLALLRPWVHHATVEATMPYEIFPFADNAGVCQEWVAIADLQTSHADAASIVGRVISLLPHDIRASNLRIVRAFAPGDRWTIAVDAQSGAGDERRAGEIASMMNALPGTGMRFHPVFYSSRELYETARVLCMPRQSVTGP